jgi:pyridoxine kinase
MKISSLDDACAVTKKLHSFGSPNVIITTLSLPLSEVPAEIHLDSSSEESLYCFTSQTLNDGTIEQYLISFPTYPGYFTGTGDLFSSLVVARLQESIEKNKKGNYSLVNAAYRVICSVNAITKNTYLYQEKWKSTVDNDDTKASSKAKFVRKCELQLIKGKKEIEEPERVGQNVVKKIQVSCLSQS